MAQKLNTSYMYCFMLGFSSSSDDTCSTSLRQPTKSRRLKQSHQVFGNRTRLQVTQIKFIVISFSVDAEVSSGSSSESNPTSKGTIN